MKLKFDSCHFINVKIFVKKPIVTTNMVMVKTNIAQFVKNISVLELNSAPVVVRLFV